MAAEESQSPKAAEMTPATDDWVPHDKMPEMTTAKKMEYYYFSLLMLEIFVILILSK